MKTSILLTLGLLLSGCFNQTQSQTQSQSQNQSNDSVPAWVQTIIQEDAKKPLNDAVQEIWKISHQGKIAYFMVSPCCDQYNPLYNDTGKAICYPTGGIVGRGDGNCPKPADKKSKPILIWSHPQSQIKQHDASYLINDGGGDVSNMQ